LKRFDVGVALICTLAGGDVVIRNGGRYWLNPGDDTTVPIGLNADF
jgi:nitrogen fixation protein